MRTKVKSSYKLSESQLHNLADAFKVMGDTTKLRICILLSGGEYSVSEIAEILELSHSATSHSLKTLRNMRLVKYRREGKNIFYSLDDKHVEDLLQIGCEHVKEKRG